MGRKNLWLIFVLIPAITGFVFLGWIQNQYAFSFAPSQEVPQNSSVDSTISIASGSSSPSNAKFYEPPTLTIPVGTTVTWKNSDTTLHTVTSGSAESGISGTIFDSSYMAGGKTFQWTFSSAGTFEYYCTLHPFMKGTVIAN